jgi:DNA polymerase I-like protein with 3'-5' exonuclease and polymerase domains
MLARLRASQLIRQAGIEALLVSTVHDSIVADTPNKNVNQVAKILKESVETVPQYVKQIWNYDFSLPLTCEIQIGNNRLDMQDYSVV